MYSDMPPGTRPTVPTPWPSLAVGAALMAFTLATCAAPTAPLPSNSPVVGGQLTITGTTLLTAPGQTSQLTVKDASGTTLTTGVTWTSSVSTVASVSPSGFVTAIAFGTTAVTAKTSSANGGASVYVTPAAGATKSLTSCGSVTGSSAYVLTADVLLPAPSTGNCVTISSVGSVQFDCAGHVIQGLTIQNANTATIANCVVTKSVTIAGASNITLTNITANAGVNVSNSTAVTITGSTINPAPSGTPNVNASFDTGLRIQGNVINTLVTPIYGVFLTSGSGNQVVQNTIIGDYDGGTTINGPDDGVLMITETGDLVQGNTIRGFFDTAVEGVNYLANTTIADNTISNIGTSAVSSYWCTNWTGNVVRNNTVTQAPLLLYVNYSIGGFQCGLAGTANAFSGNQIVGNHFRAPITGTQGSVPGPKGSVPTSGPTARIIVVLPAPVTGNVIQGNDFGTTDGPYLVPLSGFTDGGGNLCGPPNPSLSNFPCAGLGSTAVFTRRR
jgi:hypothetical protein